MRGKAEKLTINVVDFSLYLESVALDGLTQCAEYSSTMNVLFQVQQRVDFNDLACTKDFQRF